MTSFGSIQERHKAELEKALLTQLGATQEILSRWESADYPADGHTVSRFWELIGNAKAVRIVGDYDCDGICASHICESAISEIYPDKPLSVRIPKRFSEGYGISSVIVEEIIREMPRGSVVITVDNGISAPDLLEQLEDAGMTVLMTDHHELKEGGRLPKISMAVNPSVSELPEALPGNYWCGAAVAYKLCEPMLSEQKADELAIYAALATVADCMPLKEGNWGLVRKSIEAFRKEKAPEVLCNLLIGMKQDPRFCQEDSFGFYLGPAFNAPGRLLDNGAQMVLDCLQNPTEEKIKEILALNEQRKTIRDQEMELVRQKIEEEGLAGNYPIWVEVDGLHEGIVGILAGKVAEEYKTPAIVMTNLEDGTYKGSARSYGSFDIFRYLTSMAGEFLKVGGHAGAAGLSMTKEAFLRARGHQLSLEDSSKEKESVNGIRMKINLWEIPGINSLLQNFRPFGEGNAAPRFEVEVDFRTDHPTYMGTQKNHLLLQEKGVWKVTHFSHEPNQLVNKQHFGLVGTISGSAFAGRETPTLNAEEAFDLEEIERISRDEEI